jgi:hypothetical protein
MIFKKNEQVCFIEINYEQFICQFKVQIFSEIKDLNELSLIENKNKIYLLFILLIGIINKESK